MISVKRAKKLAVERHLSNKNNPLVDHEILVIVPD